MSEPDLKRDIAGIVIMAMSGVIGSAWACSTFLFNLLGLPLFIFGPTSQYIIGTLLFLGLIFPIGIGGNVLALGLWTLIVNRKPEPEQ